MSTLSNIVDNSLKQYGHLIYNANQKLNLVSRKINLQDINNLIKEALLPSSWDVCNLASPILDIGTGAGLPGLPIKMANTATSITLLDSNRRKCNFLKTAISILNLSNVIVVCERAEVFANESDNITKYQTIVSRGVGKLGQMLDWADKMLKSDGELILWKGESVKAELAEIDQSIWEEPQYLSCSSQLVLVRIVRK